MRKYAWIYIIIGIFVVIWGGRSLLKPRVEIELATLTTYEDKISASGVLIRDETIYTTSSGGMLESLVSDGQRVANGEKIAVVYKDGIDSETKAKLDDIDKKISQLEAMQTNEDIFDSDIATIKNQVKIVVDEIIDASNSREYGNIKILKDTLNSLTGRYSDVSGTTNAKSSALNTLKQEKKQLEEQIDSERTVIYSNGGGIYIPIVDGYENILNPKTSKDMTVEEYKELKEREPVMQSAVLNPGDVVCKTVENSSWTVACLITEDQAYGIKKGSKIGLRIPSKSSSTLSAVVENISDPLDGEVVIQLSCGQYLDGIYSDRNVDIEIIKVSYTGILVDKNALRLNEDGENGVYISSNGVAKFRRINILYNNDDIMIVENTEQTGWLKVYDYVIVKGKNIEQNTIID